MSLPTSNPFGDGNTLGEVGPGDAFAGNVGGGPLGRSTPLSAADALKEGTAPASNMSPEITQRFNAPDGSFGGADHVALRQSFADLSMTGDEVTSLRQANAAPADERAGWRDASLAAHDPNTIDAARQVVAPHAELSTWLHTTGVGDHPDAVSTFASRANGLAS